MKKMGIMKKMLMMVTTEMMGIMVMLMMTMKMIGIMMMLMMTMKTMGLMMRLMMTMTIYLVTLKVRSSRTQRKTDKPEHI